MSMKMMMGAGPAETAEEQVRRWDNRDLGACWSVSMGGLGPGYEQCIQLLAIEITRDNLGKELPKDADRDAWHKWGDDTASRLSHNGFSGAQVGAAKNLAVGWLRHGPKWVLEQVEKERHIQISKAWPTVVPPRLTESA